MKKYRLIKGEPREPRDEEILRHKDFNRLVYNYERATKPIYQKPLYKDPKVFLALVFILVIAWLVFSEIDPQKKDQSPSNPPATEQLD